tara:strand:+ start:114 stop:827 length:714 start_codon:yes stop_codon:yes gene_type:complete
MLCFVLGKHIASVITHVHRPMAEFCCYSQTRLNAQRAFDHAGTGTSASDTWAMIPTIMTTPPVAPGLELERPVRHCPVITRNRGAMVKNQTNRRKGWAEAVENRERESAAKKRARQEQQTTQNDVQEGGEAVQPVLMPELHVRRLHALVEDNILLHLELQGCRVLSSEMEATVSAHVMSTVDHDNELLIALGTVDDDIATLVEKALQRLVFVNKIFKFGHKYQFNTAHAGGGGGGGS